MRSVRFARLFSFPFSCSRSAPTVWVAISKRRRNSGSTYIFHSAHSSAYFPFTGELNIRCSAAGAPSVLALAGICRSSSARNGSSSEISIWFLRRRISMTKKPSQLWRVEDNRAVAAHRVRLVPAYRSTKSNGLCDALLACASPPYRADNRRRAGKPLLHSSSNLPDHCGPPPATADRGPLPHAFLFQSSARRLWMASNSLEVGGLAGAPLLPQVAPSA